MAKIYTVFKPFRPMNPDVMVMIVNGDGEMAEWISSALATELKINVSCERMQTPIPKEAYNPRRNQYSAVAIIDHFSKLKKYQCMVLIVIEEDIYVPGLNYCFGLALGRVAVVSTKRLDPSFYGEKFNKDLFKSRLVKEAVHEIGHLMGLSHCTNRTCVMSFSNWIGDTDIKSQRLCDICKKKVGR